MMKMMRLIYLLVAVSLISACSYVSKLDRVVPDKRADYEKAEPMPDLEVPPDLTAEASNNALTIPGEGASLSQYQRSRSSRAITAAPVAAGKSAGPDLMNEQWVVVSGTARDIWPRLAAFFKNKGYSLDLNDADLGVLETKWSTPRDKNGVSMRNMYRIISEAGEDPGVTVLYITCESQIGTGTGDQAQWQEKKEDLEAEKLMAGELNVLLNGTTAGRTPTAATTPRPTTEQQDAGND